MIVVDGVTGMPGGGWVGQAPAGPAPVAAYVRLLLLPFCIVPFSSLPIVLQSLFKVACRRGVARGGDLDSKEKKHY